MRDKRDNIDIANYLFPPCKDKAIASYIHTKTKSIESESVLMCICRVNLSGRVASTVISVCELLAVCLLISISDILILSSLA